VATVREAVAGGVTIVQLRDKTASDDDLVRLATTLREALAGTGVPLIVNDRPIVAKHARLAGVHMGQDDGDPRAARRLLGADALIGLSVTRAGEVATVDPATVDYVGLGPVFATGSKADAAPPLGIASMSEIGTRLPLPYVAIGGIGETNAAAIMAAGAAGVAVVSAIGASGDPRTAAARLRAEIDGAAGR
jgi:thiamine-phosphate pyrophosphorylase